METKSEMKKKLATLKVTKESEKWNEDAFDYKIFFWGRLISFWVKVKQKRGTYKGGKVS